MHPKVGMVTAGGLEFHRSISPNCDPAAARVFHRDARVRTMRPPPSAPNCSGKVNSTAQPIQKCPVDAIVLAAYRKFARDVITRRAIRLSFPNEGGPLRHA